MKQFDYIIAGAGASGLTLAYLLLECEYTEKKILLLDREAKSSNDRTWCFWEKEENLFEELVYKKWKKTQFKSAEFHKTYELPPYTYKMIRGIDFYDFMKSKLQKHQNLEWLTEEITSISEDGQVITINEVYTGSYVFDSRFDRSVLENQKGRTTLLQHFKGYFLETSSPQFDPSTFTYMDFDIDQEGDCRFGYVLPFSKTTALVEYTLFNQQLLTEQEYTSRLEDYIQKLNIGDFKIREEEYGIIPMTDHPFPPKNGSKVINIGINGGFAKASTGFTFLRSQHILRKMAQNLTKGIDPTRDLPFQSARFKKYDSTLLKVLAGGKYTGDQIFGALFKQNGASNVFKFLDEETNLKEEVKIMSSTPILDFGKAFMKTLVE